MPSCPGGPWRPWRSWISPDRRGGSPPPFKAFPLGGRCPSAHTGADEGAMIAWFRLSQGSFAAFFTLRIAGGRVLVRFCNISGAQNLSGFPQFNPGPLGPRVCKNYRCCDLSSAPEFAEPTVPGSRYLIRPLRGHLPLKGKAGRYDFMPFPLGESPSEARRMRSVWATLAVTRCSRCEFWRAYAMRPYGNPETSPLPPSY